MVGTPVAAGDRIITNKHGAQIEHHAIGVRKLGPELMMKFLLFRDEREICRVKVKASLDQSALQRPLAT